MIRVIAGGKKSKNWVYEGQIEYEKRLKKPYDVHYEYWENDKITGLDRNWSFKASEYVILLDERGEKISSPGLSERLEKCFIGGKTPVFIIGGPYGVTDVIREKANLVVSFSDLVFPHELMRVILSEQIYRAQEIARGGKYHHI